MKALSIGILSCSLGLVAGSVTAAPVLRLEEYLGQVRSGHQGLQASEELRDSSQQTAREAELLTRPQLFGQWVHKRDEKLTPNPNAQGNRTDGTNFTLGVAQRFAIGLDAKISYVVNHVDIRGAALAFLPNPNYWEVAPVFELSQSLLKNGFGSEIRAQQEATEAKALATSFAESYKAKANLAEAELAYWKLSLARETVRAQKEIFDRAGKLRSWNARRTQLELADKADLLQADANLSLREMEYETALNDEKAAAEAFNLARGQKNDVVEENLEAIRPEIVAALRAPARQALRDDVKAALEGSRAARAASQLGLERNRPSLELFGSLALNHKGDSFAEARKDPLDNDTPTTVVGVKFSTPLDFGLVAKNRAAFRNEQRAAEKSYQRKVQEQEVEWQQLTRKLEETKKRFLQLSKIEDIQDRKLTNERERLARGRSSTFQVLQFEQDYINAQLNRIRLSAELLGLNAKLKTFGE